MSIIDAARKAAEARSRQKDEKYRRDLLGLVMALIAHDPKDAIPPHSFVGNVLVLDGEGLRFRLYRNIDDRYVLQVEAWDDGECAPYWYGGHAWQTELKCLADLGNVGLFPHEAKSQEEEAV